MVTECKANDIYVLDRQPCEIRGGDARQLVVVISPRAANIRRNAANVVPLLPLPETITPTATLFPLEGRYPMLVPGLLWADVAAQ
jgi:mRNA-degrading endonuclease toxin of MazEF toxin-antitoxin module